jgi:predicted MFS family arabinose efflux permease
MGLGETQVAIALGAFGGGSMLAALLLPRLLSNRPDRPVMISGAALLIATLLALADLRCATDQGLLWAVSSLQRLKCLERSVKLKM